MRDWTEPGDLDRQIQVEDAIRRAARALGRWFRGEMGYRVSWRAGWKFALAFLVVLFVLWLNEALPQAIVPGP